MSKKKRPPIPQFNQPIIESHCHLDYLTHRPLDDIMQAAQVIGVEKFITIGVSPSGLNNVFALSQNYSNVYAALGVHPHDSKDYKQETATFIQQHTANKKVVAIGEIGLDYHYNLSPKEAQKHAFSQQLDIAAKHNLPIIVHTRDADSDTQVLLQQYAPKLSAKGVIHSFTSGKELAKCALDLGFYIGINGIVTFNKAENVQEIARYVPIDRLLLETDAPYLTPAPYRGKDNEPMYLPFIAQKIAELKGIDVETLLKQIYANTQSLFFSGRLWVRALSYPKRLKFAKS